MKRFAILRNLDPEMTRQDIDSGAVETLISLSVQDIDPGAEFNPEITGVNWVRSYWAPGTSWGLCLYTGRDEEAIERYHSVCEVPFVTIREVSETDSGVAEPHFGGAGSSEPAILAIEARMDGGPAEGKEWGALAASWVRSYTDTGEGTVVGLFRTDRLDIDAVKRRARTRGWTLHDIVEIRPSDYTGGD